MSLDAYIETLVGFFVLLFLILGNIGLMVELGYIALCALEKIRGY